MYFSCPGLQRGRLHTLLLPEVKRHRRRNFGGWKKRDENLMQPAANTSLFSGSIKDSTRADFRKRQTPSSKDLFTLPETDVMQPSLLFLPSLQSSAPSGRGWCCGRRAEVAWFSHTSRSNLHSLLFYRLIVARLLLVWVFFFRFNEARAPRRSNGFSP